MLPNDFLRLIICTFVSQVQTGVAGNVPKSTGVEAGVHSSIQAETDAQAGQSSQSIEQSAVEELKTTSSVVATPSLPSDIGTVFCFI